jgi:hypothetical protein
MWDGRRQSVEAVVEWQQRMSRGRLTAWLGLQGRDRSRTFTIETSVIGHPPSPDKSCEILLLTIINCASRCLTCISDEFVETCDGRVVGRVDAEPSREINDAVRPLESIPARDLVEPVSYAKTYGSVANDVGRNLSSKEST